MGALEVTELDHGDLSVCGADGRIPFHAELLAVVGVGVGAHVEHFATEESLAVFADEDVSGIGLFVDRDRKRNLVEIRSRRWRERSEFNGEVGAPGEEVADEGFGILQELGLIWARLSWGWRLGAGSWDECHGGGEQSAVEANLQHTESLLGKAVWQIYDSPARFGKLVRNFAVRIVNVRRAI